MGRKERMMNEEKKEPKSLNQPEVTRVREETSLKADRPKPAEQSGIIRQLKEEGWPKD